MIFGTETVVLPQVGLCLRHFVTKVRTEKQEMTAADRAAWAVSERLGAEDEEHSAVQRTGEVIQ